MKEDVMKCQDIKKLGVWVFFFLKKKIMMPVAEMLGGHYSV